MARAVSVLSWALYDFANTIFYGVVVTLYLPGYVIGLSGGAHTPYSLATPPAMILAALLAPALGAYVDRSGKARRFVGAFTLLCAILSCALAVPRGATAVLVIFGAALFAYNCAIVFYNSMLPAVAREGDMARVSGLGVGLGYLSLVLVFPLAKLVVDRFDGDPRPAFVMAGVLMFAFTLPLVWFCPDPAPKPQAARAREPLSRAVASHARMLATLFARCGRDRALLCFFLGNFLCADALNAVYQLMVPFIERPEGLAMGKFWPMLAINVAAFPAAIALGVIGDRRSPKPVMIAGAISFLFAVLVPQALIELSRADALPSFLQRDVLGLPGWKVAAATCLVLFGAIGVGGVLGAARKWLCLLTPASEHGTWFGVYGLTNKLSLVGLVAFSWLADLRGDYRWSVLFLVCELAVACVLLSLAPRVRTDAASAPPTEREGP